MADETTYLLRKDNQSTGIDANTLVDIGTSNVITNVNTPTSDTYYVTTNEANSLETYQIAVLKSDTSTIFSRSYNTSTSVWSNWVQLGINTYLGKTAKATSASAADTATRATQDASGNVIANYYMPKTGTTATTPTQIGYMMTNVVREITISTIYEIVLKTKIPFVRGEFIPQIRLYGYAYGQARIIDVIISGYIYGNESITSPFINYNAINRSSFPVSGIYLSTYAGSDGNTYAAISIKFPGLYYPILAVDAFMMSASDTNKYKNWTWEWGTSATETIIPQDNLKQVSIKALVTDITGNAGTVTTIKDSQVTTSKIADRAITPAKIQSSIALEGTPSMTVEPTTSSPDKTIASVGLLKSSVDAVQIGGLNYLNNSQFNKASDWALWGWLSGISISNKDNYDCAKITSHGVYITDANSSLSKYIAQGDIYTVSADVWCDSEIKIRMSFESDVTTEPQITTLNKWHRISFTYTKSTSATFVLYPQFNVYPDALFYIKNIKIETGNKATSWTPSLADTQSAINTAESNAKAYADTEIALNKQSVTVSLSPPTNAKNGDIWIKQS